MSEPTDIAEILGIGEGFVVWVVGDSVEGPALLDPLPEAAETVETLTEDVDAALLLTDDVTTLAETLDDTLPRLGAVPLVWICFPEDDVAGPDVARIVDDYGWATVEPVRLDDTWSAARIRMD